MEILYGSVLAVAVMGSFYLGILMERGSFKRALARVRERPKPRPQPRAKPKPRPQPPPDQNWYYYSETLYKTREPGIDPRLEPGPEPRIEPWVQAQTGLGLEPDRAKSPEQRRSEFKVVGGEQDG